MPPELTPLNRRNALANALKGAIAATVVSPPVATASPGSPHTPLYVPENDYPYFGYEPVGESPNPLPPP